MRRSFSPCRKHTTTSPPQRFGIDTQPFFLYDTCRFWALHLSCTTHPDHPQLEGSAVHINTAAHAFAQRFKPHLGPNRTGSQAAPHHHPHTNTDRIGSQLHWIDSSTSWPITQALFPAHLQATFHDRIRNPPCQDGIQNFRGWCVSEDGGIVKVFPLYNQPLPPQR